MTMSATESMLIAKLRDMLPLPEDATFRIKYGHKGRAPDASWQWWVESGEDPDIIIGSRYTRTECLYYRDAEVRTSRRSRVRVFEIVIPSLETRRHECPKAT